MRDTSGHDRAWRGRGGLSAAVALLLGPALAGAQDTRPAWGGPRLLLTRELVAQVRAKAQRHEWARRLLEERLAEAARRCARPVDPPATGGGWHHNYVCPKDAGFLEFREDSPHRHWCPRCRKEYEGADLDETWVNYVHLNYARAAEACGLAYQLADRPEAADWARRVLLWYADRYDSYPVHGKWAGRGKVTAQSLDESMWLIPLVAAYDAIADTLEHEQRERIVRRLFLPAGEHIEKYIGGIHNIECWQAAARLMAALAAIQTDVDGARAARLRDKAVASLRANIEKGITSDGMWFEGSIGYHYFTLMALTPALIVARHNGIDLGDTWRLRRMYIVLTQLELPGGELPGLNDGAPGQAVQSLAPYLEAASYVFGDEELERLLARIYDRSKTRRTHVNALVYGPPELPEGGGASSESCLLDGIGLVVLRDGGNTVIIKAGSHHGGHDHADRLNLVFADAQRLWFADLGTPGYGHPLYRNWYRHTASHCTVTVDGRPQKLNVPGRIVQFDNAPAFKMAVVACDDAYPGVSMRRTAALAGGAVMDVFELESDTEHEYAFTLHGPPGELRLDTPPERTGPEALEYGPVRIPLVSAAARFVRGQWRAGSAPGDALGFCVTATLPMDVFSGPVPGYPGHPDRQALVVRARGRGVRFAGCYAPGTNEPPLVQTAEGGVSFAVRGRAYTVRDENGRVRVQSRGDR